jgi:hypothetical protein
LQLTAWKQLPKLSALAGLIERTDLGWGHTSLQSNTAATCLKLDKQIDLSNMPFIERIRLAAIKCRLTMCSTSGDKVEFERSLAELINLLSRGVPPDAIGSAKACLDATVDWLVSGIVKTTIIVPAGELLQRLYRIRANDYRLNILIYLQNNEHIASKINAQNELQHIHSGLFFHALQEQNDSKKYIELFYRSLNSESKKELFIYSSRKIFLEMNTEQAQDNWQLVCGQLFERQTTPFVTIIDGHPCEAGLLFYVVQASLGAKQSIDWLGQKNVTSIINSSESLLRQRSSSFNQVQIVELLNCLALSHHKNHLFQHWSELLNILTYLDPANKLYDFLQIGLSQLNKELEFNNETYQVFFSHCRAEPKLRKLLSALTKKTKLTKQKVTKPKAQSKSNKQNKSESAPKQPTAEPQLNIFGDLL